MKQPTKRPTERQTDRQTAIDRPNRLNDARMFSMNVGRRPSHGTMDGMKHHHTSRSVRKLSTDTGLSEKFPHWLGDGCQTSGVCDSAALSRRPQTFERIALKLTSQIYAFVPYLPHSPPTPKLDEKWSSDFFNARKTFSRNTEWFKNFVVPQKSSREHGNGD